MLYKLGKLTIKVHPFNVDRVRRNSRTDFAEKPVVGAEPRQEYVGEGPNTMTLSGSLFPKVLGGLNELALLHSARVKAEPQFLSRGDGKPMGWYVIKEVSEDETYLAGDGVGQKIAVVIKLTRTKAPRAETLFKITSGILAR